MSEPIKLRLKPNGSTQRQQAVASARKRRARKDRAKELEEAAASLGITMDDLKRRRYAAGQEAIVAQQALARRQQREAMEASERLWGRSR